jgi:hypothetical protein
MAIYAMAVGTVDAIGNMSSRHSYYISGNLIAVSVPNRTQAYVLILFMTLRSCYVGCCTSFRAMVWPQVVPG